MRSNTPSAQLGFDALLEDAATVNHARAFKGGGGTSPQLIAELRELRAAMSKPAGTPSPAPASSGQAPAFAGRQLRRIWWRALWITALFWLVAAAGVWLLIRQYGFPAAL